MSLPNILLKTVAGDIRRILKKRNPEPVPQFSAKIELPISLLIDKCQFISGETDNVITLPCTYPYKKKVSTASSSADGNRTTSSFMIHFSDDNPQKFAETNFYT